MAIYESVFALMESILADYEVAGIIRERSGASLPGVAPSNVVHDRTTAGRCSSPPTPTRCSGDCVRP